MKKQINILIFGPQGSGKGTQAKLLADSLNLPQLSIGQLYRQEIKKATPVGHKAEIYVSQGRLVPLNITGVLLKKELQKSKYKKGLILDGFPRNLQQARYLHKLISPNYLVVMTLPQKETIKRISARRICQRCGENYNVFAKQSRQGDTCHNCGGSLVRRKDDFPKAIKARLQIYSQQTLPVIEYYRKLAHVFLVNGQGSVAEVFSRIIKGFKEHGLII